jgi:hypothetical protein
MPRSDCLTDQAQKRAAGVRIEFLRGQRAILVGVCRIEAFFDKGEIFFFG